MNSYFSQLGEGLGAIVPPQVASIARKPLSIALEEIAVGKVRANFDLDRDGPVESAEAEGDSAGESEPNGGEAS